MQVTIELPDDVDLDEHEAKEQVVALLYEAGTLSESRDAIFLDFPAGRFKRCSRTMAWRT